MTTTQRFLGAMTALMIAASTNAQSAPSPIADVTIVLVHGALIDGSSWRGVYDVLTRDGYRVSIAQPPLTGLEEDVAAIQRVIDQLLELRIALRHHDAVGIARERVGQEGEIIRRAGGRLEAGEKNIVLHEGRGTAGLDQQEGFGVILALQDLHPKAFFRIEFGNELRGVGALCHRNGLAFQIVCCLQAR